MKIKPKSFALLLLTLLGMSCAPQENKIDVMIADYPHGERRIRVEQTGEAYLSYGARPQFQVIKPGVFSVENLYAQLQDHLHENQPREQWPDRTSECGMVTVYFSDGTKKDFLIFDKAELMGEIFTQAEQNIVGERL
ncbi:MAG: hypothetical protein ACYSQY_01015 [Planctomycetota bacterium]|jgi:hypothetical protein